MPDLPYRLAEQAAHPGEDAFRRYAPHQLRPPQRLVENRTTYGGKDVEFAMYDTYQQASYVALQAAHPLYCGMVTGKKVIHAKGQQPFAFLPHESLVLPSNEEIHIDFPEAQRDQPTTCLTIEIERDKVQQVVASFNDRFPRSPDSGDWRYGDDQPCHFGNPKGIDRVLDTLVQLFTESNDTPLVRDALVDVKVSELLLRMLQTESRALLLGAYEKQASNHRLAAAIAYVRANLHRHIEVAELADAAHMSVPSLYRYFRNELGITPLHFIHHQRMNEARRLLNDPRRSVTDVSFAMGFSSVSHFIQLFERFAGVTPKQYQMARVRHIRGLKA